MDQYSQWTQQGGFEELSCSIWSCVGEKSASFLHGQLTNHINGLKEGEGNYNLLLTTRGKIVGDLYVTRAGNGYTLVIDKNQTEKIIEPLKKLAPLSRVILNDESGKYSVVHVCVQNPPLGGFRSDRLGLPGWDILVPSIKKSEFILTLEKQGLMRIDSDLHEIIRVEQGISQYGIDFDDNNLPQESRLDRALHFDKGCYLGQEIIARLHFRGHVNKVLVGLKIDSNKTVLAGSPIYDEEKEVGKITSAIISPKSGQTMALGYIPYNSNQPLKKFLVGFDKKEAEIVELPPKR